MAILDKFLTVETPTIDSLMLEENKSIAASNTPSNRNMASYAAVVSGDPENIEETYRRSVDEYEQTGSSPSAEAILNTARAKSIQAARGDVIDFLANPEATDEEKQSVANQYLDEANEQHNIRNIVSLETLADDAGPESVEEEFVRVGLADSIENVNEYKRQAQALLNREVAKSSTDTMDAFMDIAEILVPFTESKNIGSILAEYRGEGNKVGAYTKALTLLGDAKSDLRGVLENLPAQERMQVAQKLVDIVNSHSSVVMPDENDYARVDALRTILEDGYYDDDAAFLDNMVSVLDLTIIGGAVARIARGTGLTEKAIRAAKRASVRSRVQPTSVSQNIKDTNPEKFKAAHDMAMRDETGEAAEALYGTTREDAIANDLLWEIDGDDVFIASKVGRPGAMEDGRLKANEGVLGTLYRDGKIYYSEGERARATSNKVNEFFKATGMMPRTNMSRVGEHSNGVSIKAVYGPENGGWANAADAIEQVKFNLRANGITDDNITLLRREGDGYVPTTIRELEAMEEVSKVMKSKGKQPRNVKVKTKKDFLVQVDYDYAINPLDITKFDAADVRLNFFDRSTLFAGESQGSFARHLLDAHSMLDPRITQGANVSVDRAAYLEQQLLDLGTQFSDIYTKLPKARQGTIETVIKEANAKGEWPKRTSLVADGFTPDEIKALDAWKESWDTMYWMENRDLVKTLRSQNYQLLVDSASDTRLFAKPMSRQQAGSGAKAFDSTTGQIVHLTADDLTELYSKGGSIASMKRPMAVGEDSVTNVIARGDSRGPYLRALNDNDQALNYREGYYTVQYNAPKFVVERVHDGKGNFMYERAVSTAGNTQDAEHIARRMKSTTGGEYYVRGDIKQKGVSSDEYWDLQQSHGRTAQRVRGKRLEDTTMNGADSAEHQFVLGPVDSLINAARSTANRVAMRDYLEATKARFLTQYADQLPQKFGKPLFPSSSKDIGKPGLKETSEAADARTTWEYINFLEQGYINGIDDIVKSTFNILADAVAPLSKTAERGARAVSEARGVGSFAKNVAFQMYLALNPLRQLVIQSHQAIQLTALHPEYVLSQKMSADVGAFMAMRMGFDLPESVVKGTGRSRKELEKMLKNYERSGLSASIDKQNLVRGSLSEMADMAAYRGNKNFVSKVVSASRKIGFDWGEDINMMTSWLANYDKAVKEGKVINQTTLDDITARARNFTYNMNAAGDMPYNQNFLSTVFQFFQVPHKAMLQFTTNRVLTPAEKARVAGFSALMYSAPPAMMYGLFGDILPEDQDLADAIVQGLEGVMFNKTLELLTGEEQSIDFSGLAPVDMYGTYEFITSLWTTDLGTLVSETPSGQLFFGHNPRIADFVSTAARYVGLQDDYEQPTTLGNVAHSFASMASGYSNAFKAAYAYKYGQKINSLGGVTDPEVTTTEAIAQAFGFPTMEETRNRLVNTRIYADSDAFKKDVQKWYSDLKRVMAREGMTAQEADFQLRVLGEAWRVFGGTDVQARTMIRSMLERDIRKGDSTLYDSVLRTTRWEDASEVKKLISTMPSLSDQQRDDLNSTVEFIEKHKDEN